MPACLSIQDTVWQFQQSSQFTDLVLACDDGTVPVHKVMLAEVFSLLGIADHDQDIECVILPGVEVAVLEEALQDVYLAGTELGNIIHIGSKNTALF